MCVLWFHKVLAAIYLVKSQISAPAASGKKQQADRDTICRLQDNNVQSIKKETN